MPARPAQVLVHIEEQSPEIGAGVHGMGTKALEEVGAGDQGHMFGYATDETEQLMPLTHVLATQLGYRLTEVCLTLSNEADLSACPAQQLALQCPSPQTAVAVPGRLAALQTWQMQLLPPLRAAPVLLQPVRCTTQPRSCWLQARKNGTCPWLRPDGKTQVTVEYLNDKGAMVPQRVHTILISTQHSPDVDNDYIHKELLEHVIKPVVPAKYMDDKTIFHLNPSGAAAAPMLECDGSAAGALPPRPACTAAQTPPQREASHVHSTAWQRARHS